jgi:hypothetical protein
VSDIRTEPKRLKGDRLCDRPLCELGHKGARARPRIARMYYDYNTREVLALECVEHPICKAVLRGVFHDTGREVGQCNSGECPG